MSKHQHARCETGNRFITPASPAYTIPTRQQMLEELATLKPVLPRDADQVLRGVVERVISDNGALIFREMPAGYWTTRLGVLQLERTGGAIQSWELVIVVYAADMAAAWNTNYCLQNRKNAKSRNGDRKRAKVGKDILPEVTAVLSSSLINRSARWRALFSVMRQMDNSGLYLEIEKILS